MLNAIRRYRINHSESTGSTNTLVFVLNAIRRYRINHMKRFRNG